MNTNTNDIEVSIVPRYNIYRTTYRIIIEDDLCIAGDGISTSFHTNHHTFSNYETMQLAGALIALATLTTDDKNHPHEALIPIIETLNTIRKKAGKKPLDDLANFIENP